MGNDICWNPYFLNLLDMCFLSEYVQHRHGVSDGISVALE